MKQGFKWMLDPESPFYVRPRPSPALLSWVYQFRRAATHERVHRSMPVLLDLLNRSRALFDEFAAIPGFSFDFQARGLLNLFRTTVGERTQKHEADLASRMGVEARLMDRRGLEALQPGVPFVAPGGVYYPGDAHLDPARFVAGLRALLEQQGVRLLTSHPVLGLNHDGRKVTGVRCAGETVCAADFVLAAGSWSPRLAATAGIRLPLQPGKGYSVTLPAPRINLTVPLILTESRVAVTPLGDRIRYAGTMELAGLDLSINLRRVNAIKKAVPLYLEGVDPRARRGPEPWAGLRPCSPDGMPYIGRFRRYPNLIAATGHAMLGISLAPVTGRLVAELVAGKPPSVDLTLLAPDRFG
jgi:D-amino-acid dehydrogenase